MKLDRGDLVLVLFPGLNLQTAKRRQTLVVQADNLGTGLPQIIVALVTSNMARASHPSRVAVKMQTPTAQASGLRTDSVIMTDNLATVLEIEIDRVIGRLTDMADIDAALKNTLGLQLSANAFPADREGAWRSSGNHRSPARRRISAWAI